RAVTPMRWEMSDMVKVAEDWKAATRDLFSRPEFCISAAFGCRCWRCRCPAYDGAGPLGSDCANCAAALLDESADSARRLRRWNGARPVNAGPRPHRLGGGLGRRGKVRPLDRDF